MSLQEIFDRYRNVAKFMLASRSRGEIAIERYLPIIDRVEEIVNLVEVIYLENPPILSKEEELREKILYERLREAMSRKFPSDPSNPKSKIAGRSSDFFNLLSNMPVNPADFERQITIIGDTHTALYFKDARLETVSVIPSHKIFRDYEQKSTREKFLAWLSYSPSSFRFETKHSMNILQIPANGCQEMLNKLLTRPKGKKINWDPESLNQASIDLQNCLKDINDIRDYLGIRLMPEDTKPENHPA